VIKEQERKEGTPSIGAKQLILVRADQLLNITITKSGLDLVQRLSALFNDVYNKRLPPTDDDDQPLLSVINKTGRELQLDHFIGLAVRLDHTSALTTSLSLQFTSDAPTGSVTLQQNESMPLNVYNENQIHGRLSVIEEQASKNPQEFSVKVSLIHWGVHSVIEETSFSSEMR
jgi:hypothetical protein